MMTVEEQAFADPAIPLITTEAIPVCDLCGGTARQPYAHGRDFELQTCRNEWTFVQCRTCAHVWLDPRPAVAELPTIYPSAYYAYAYEDRIPRLARAGKALLDRRKLGDILRSVGRPVRAYADIGCGTGRYLRAMAQTGLPRTAIHGLELDADVVQQLRDEGFMAHHSRVESCDAIPDGSLDLATMFHVIEHVDSPAAVLDKLAGWLAPGGVVALETPNLNSLDARLFRDRWWGGYHIPRHWHLFTPETIQHMLRQHGFEPFSIRYQTGHSFWMYSMHHALRYRRPGRPWLSRQFDPMRSVALIGGFTAFDLLRGALGARTSAMLVLARRSGDRRS
jgi:2-polyprenyl-3-methyl-5-hydroxy-6-metoxy-1,4-benzoquinol methylase